MDTQNQNQQNPNQPEPTLQQIEQSVAVAGPGRQDTGSIHWQASEFVMHDKPSWWYAAFAGTALLFSAFFLLLLKDITAAVAILAVFALAYMMAVRKPRTLDYILDDRGITIGERVYPFEEFRSFSLVRDGGLESVFLHPLQRFALPIIIYFAPDDAETIVNALSFHLPHEDRDMSPVDRLSRTLRF